MEAGKFLRIFKDAHFTSLKPNHLVLQFVSWFIQVYGCTLPAAATLEAFSFPAYPVSVVYQFCQFNSLLGQLDNIDKTCFLGILKYLRVFFYAWLSVRLSVGFIRQLQCVGFS